MYAQGGVAAVMQPAEFDNMENHFKDTIVAGAGLCDEKAVRVLVGEAWSNIEELIKIGVPFDTDNGTFLLTKEGGHGKNRILHCGGDATGLHLTRSLYEESVRRSNIKIINYMFLTDILTNQKGVCGVQLMDAQNEAYRFIASKVIIASGGVGHVFRNSTNAVCATGDGIAAAYRAGAELKDMEFVQFHPTSFIHPNENGRYFLISEALRGEGAVLKNRRGESFMRDVHPLADLAPRDIVSRAIITEMQKNDIPNVYLDNTGRSRSF
jgi:L-aspartate oxidase